MPKRGRDGGESSDEEKDNETTVGRKVIVLLDLANLETVKTKNGEFELLNCDDHVAIMKKNKKVCTFTQLP